MIQIAIWGIAMMLVVKGLDILHQQKIAEKAGQGGSAGLALVACVIAFVFGAILIVTAGRQAESSSGALSQISSHDRRSAAERAWNDATPEVKANVEGMMAEIDAKNESGE